MQGGEHGEEETRRQEAQGEGSRPDYRGHAHGAEGAPEGRQAPPQAVRPMSRLAMVLWVYAVAAIIVWLIITFGPDDDDRRDSAPIVPPPQDPGIDPPDDFLSPLAPRFEPQVAEALAGARLT